MESCVPTQSFRLEWRAAPPSKGYEAPGGVSEPRVRARGERPNLVSALEGRGYAEDRLDAILGGNLTAFLRSALPS